MIIRSITLQNFLCYYGENRFDFTDGLNIVLGANGYGKSKLFDAFQWVFNNQITDPQYDKIPTSQIKGGLVSEKAKAETSIGEKIETKVTIEVISNRRNEYQISRKYFIHRKSETEWIEGKGSKLEIKKKNVIAYSPIPVLDQSRILEDLIQDDVRPYVWFQGERGISKLINTKDENALRNVVNKLSNIDRWDNYIQVAEAAQKTANNAFDKALRAARKGQQRIKDAQNKRYFIQSNIEKTEKAIQSHKQNLNGATEKRTALQVKLENAETLKGLMDDYEKIQYRLKSITQSLEQAALTFNKKMFDDVWILKDTEGFIQQYEEKHTKYEKAKMERRVNEKVEEVLQTRLPRGIPAPKYLKEMLEKQHCLVCDRPAEEGSTAYEAIDKLWQDAQPKAKPKKKYNNLNPFFTRLYQNGLALKSDIVNVDENIKTELEKRQQLSKQYNKLKTDLENKQKEINRQSNFSSGNPLHIINEFYTANEDADHYNRKLGSDEEKLKRLKKELNEVEEELNNLAVDLPPTLKAKKTILSDFVELTKRIKDKKYQELMQLLESKANEHYKNINEPTGAFYGKLVFDGSYEIGYRPLIINPKNGENITSSLNTSVISSMNLAIIMAIMSANTQRNYNHFYPLIADAPVSDFDVVKTKSFLIEASKTFSQSIIIMKELLIEDKSSENRYRPDIQSIQELTEEIEQSGKKINIIQLTLPNGVTPSDRSQIEVKVKPLSIN